MSYRQYELDAAGAAERVISLLRSRGETLGLAESCTGGRVSSALTAIPGASDVFTGAVVSYANAVKQQLLGVAAATLEDHGAVSEECASEMAAGARLALRSSWAAAITGIAGPGGGSPEKPVGLVHFAWAGPVGDVSVSRQLFAGSRDEIQWQAVCFCLGGLEALLA